MLCFNLPLSFCMLYLFVLNRRLQMFSWSSNRVFFLMTNMMIPMLLKVQGDIFQQIATKLNDWFRLKNIKYFIPRVSMFTSFLASVSNDQLASLKSYWCMYAYLNLSKHKKDLTKQNSIPLCMYVVCPNNLL